MFIFNNIFLAGSSAIISMDEQISTASTSQREDTNNFVPRFETCVETTRLERALDEDIIGIIFIHF